VTGTLVYYMKVYSEHCTQNIDVEACQDVLLQTNIYIHSLIHYNQVCKITIKTCYMIYTLLGI